MPDILTTRWTTHPDCPGAIFVADRPAGAEPICVGVIDVNSDLPDDMTLAITAHVVELHNRFLVTPAQPRPEFCVDAEGRN